MQLLCFKEVSEGKPLGITLLIIIVASTDVAVTALVNKLATNAWVERATRDREIS